MKITIKQLEVLRAVALAGSINNARKSLGMAQPTISQQIAKMEEILGTQLFHRGQINGVKLTPAGEFWFRYAEDVLAKIDLAIAQHKSTFSSDKIELHFAATPSLSGQFVEEAAKISLQIQQFSSFEFVWARTSSEIVEMINSHRINCGVVSAASVENFKSSLSIMELFDDEIIWVVPSSIPNSVISEALLDKTYMPPPYDALNRYVDVGPGIPWQPRLEDWYRFHLPHASPYFSCMTYQSAVDIAAGGLGCCHCPLSLLPSLPVQIRNRVKFFRMNELARKAAFVMPRHLLSLPAFVEFRSRVSNFIASAYPPNAVIEMIGPTMTVADLMERTDQPAS
jgi:DNA-binding transcriptional LysR family regulator